jgi:undecaprenyl phosphate N,N'-diacetylbacillosamine 1-phosphate transferase
MLTYKSFFKRITDFSVSLIALVMLSPVFIFILVLLSFSNRGKPFFVQTRPGLNGSLFKILKFRTMRDIRDRNGHLLPDEQRLTKVGVFVRKTSLDEIPQLLNVLLGDMSLIGPRPLLVQYLPLYTEFQNKRHNVRPGITGWAQVNGRNAIGWSQKFELDVWYVDNVTFLLDLKILMLTLKKVIKASDINSSDNTTMEAFKGN